MKTFCPHGLFFCLDILTFPFLLKHKQIYQDALLLAILYQYCWGLFGSSDLQIHTKIFLPLLALIKIIVHWFQTLLKEYPLCLSWVSLSSVLINSFIVILIYSSFYVSYMPHACACDCLSYFFYIYSGFKFNNFLFLF